MWSNWKMKSTTFIHNDDANFFHMGIKRTQKLVVMGYIDFEDHALVKRWRVSEKMNVTGRTLKDEKKYGNHQKQFTFIVGSCAHFRSFGVRSIISHGGVDDDKSIAKGDKDGVA